MWSLCGNRGDKHCSRFAEVKTSSERLNVLSKAIQDFRLMILCVVVWIQADSFFVIYVYVHMLMQVPKCWVTLEYFVCL